MRFFTFLDYLKAVFIAVAALFIAKLFDRLTSKPEDDLEEDDLEEDDPEEDFSTAVQNENGIDEVEKVAEMDQDADIDTDHSSKPPNEL